MASWSRGPAVRVAVLFVAAASTTGASTTGAAFAFLPQPSTSADTVRDAEHLSRLTWRWRRTNLVRRYGMPLRKRYRDALVWHVREAAVTLDKALLLDACDAATSESADEPSRAEARAAIEEHVSELAALDPSTADADMTTGGGEWALRYEFPALDEREVCGAYYMKYSDRDLRVVGDSEGWLAIYERIAAR